MSRRVGDEFLLVPVRGQARDLEAIYALNEVAGFLWERLRGSASTTDLCHALEEAYDVEPARAATDVTVFLEELRRLGAVIVEDEP